MSELFILPADAATLFASWLLAIAALALAYAVFALAGFGSALVASAPLAQVLPVARVIPLLALLDCGSASLRAWRARAAIDRPALLALLPGMLLGQLLGVSLLASLPAPAMALLMGGFVMLMGVRGLFASAHEPGRLPAWLWGIFGGVLGGLFGSGGFIYAACLERRLPRDAFRATQAMLIALSTAWRLLLCLQAGLVDWPLLGLALALAPVMAVGLIAGRQLDLRLSREQLFRLLNVLLILCGAALILRFG